MYWCLFIYVAIASIPSISSLSHPSCVPVNTNIQTSTGVVNTGSVLHCPIQPDTNERLTVIGHAFLGDATELVVFHNLCIDTPTRVAGARNTNFTCTLASHPAGTTIPVQVMTAGGVSSVTHPITVSYGKFISDVSPAGYCLCFANSTYTCICHVACFVLLAYKHSFICGLYIYK